MEIKPTHVTPEQAKLLKEKGFNVKVKRFIDLTSNTQIKDAPSGNYNLTNQSVSIPEQWQVVEWLRVKYNIHIDLSCYYNPQKLDKIFYESAISSKENGFEGLIQNASNRINSDWLKEPSKYWLFNSPQEAYSAAFDYCLKKLL